MGNIELLSAERKRTYLPVKYGTDIVKFAYPPVKGTHKECFETLAKDKELRPAQGIELALLTYGAYTGKDEWASIRQDCFRSNYVRTPNRILWIPKGFINKDKSLSGVLVERDLSGKGLSTKMKVPSDFSSWKEKDGLYLYGGSVFVPADKYKLGEMTEKDGFARAILSDEGVPMFIKTAKDAKLTSYNWGLNVNELKEPIQRVALLDESSGRLGLGGSGWGGNPDGRAFGCVTAKPTKKIR